jgi:K+-transporting ATPase ATPase C chain
MLRRQLLTGFLTVVCLIVLLTVVYPLAVWAVGRVAFPHQTDGSFVKVNGKAVGSSLIGQNFSDNNGNPLPQYFQPRPSAAGKGYDPTSSSGSNLGPSNPNLIGNNIDNPSANPYKTPADPFCVPVPATDKSGNPITDAQGNAVFQKNPDQTFVCNPNTVPERAIAYRQLNGLGADAKVPVDAVTASGSGLDPDISEANALIQATRVASTRHLNPNRVVTLVHQHSRGRTWAVLGEKTVNVLDLNVALDRLGS